MLRVLIAGGGIGGITAALALRQRGIPFDLFEQAQAFRQVGAGIQISANATRILRKLGLGDALAAVAVYPEARAYYAWDTAEHLYSTPLGKLAEDHFGAPYYSAHRADLLGVLLGGLGTDGVRLGSQLTGFTQDEDGVTVTLADGSIAHGDVLIGADGIHSVVRAQLFGREHPRYTGNVAWRGLVPAERVAHLGLGTVNGVWMGPNRSIVQYYVSSGRTFNWIGISRTEGAARESWLAEGSVEDALAEYSGWHRTIRTIIGATPRLLRQALYDREPLPDWQSGRVVLLGDAAHPMLPFFAQGAAQSIEDAYVLAGCLAASPHDPVAALADPSASPSDPTAAPSAPVSRADLVAALARYVRLRQPRTAWMQGFARREEELYQTNDPAAIAERNARMREARQLATAPFPPEQERLYAYDAALATTS